MRLCLRCHSRVHLGNGRGFGRHVEVMDATGTIVPRFDLMCACLDCDVESGGTNDHAEWISKVECGELHSVEIDGNGWIAHVTRDKVWFEGLYGQGDGGEVTFNQFIFALQTYIRFLADPERKPIEVEFPAQ